MGESFSHRSRANGSHNSLARRLASGLPLFLSKWTQIVYHGSPLYIDTMHLALRDEDFGKNEAILLRFPRKYGAVGEGSKPVAPVLVAI
jgi:hypothetical protein